MALRGRGFSDVQQADRRCRFDVTSVLILRHESIPVAMESSLWENTSSRGVRVNDMGQTRPLSGTCSGNQSQTNFLAGMGLNELIDSGVLVGVCDML